MRADAGGMTLEMNVDHRQRSAGQGAFSVELELTETLSKLNYHFFATKRYMSRISGGHNFHMFRIADHPVMPCAAAPGSSWSPWTMRRTASHKPGLREGRHINLPAHDEGDRGRGQEAVRNRPSSNTALSGLVLSAGDRRGNSRRRPTGEGGIPQEGVWISPSDGNPRVAAAFGPWPANASSSMETRPSPSGRSSAVAGSCRLTR